MQLQQVLSLVRRACDDYNMIEDGDKIAVGISGGKDSLTLLTALAHMRRFYPKKYELVAITIDLGFNNLNLDKITEFCKDLDVEYVIVKTDIAQIVFEERKEKSPCSLCAKMRKGALNDAMKAKGVNKIAYAHHKDDVVDTMMMSLIYEGRFHTFAPVTYLDRTDLHVIRPLIYLNEADVIGFVNKNNIPVVKSPCPVDKHTKREYVKDLLKDLNRENPGVKQRMFTAIKDSNLNGWTNKG
ncbi:tRNA(Ile)-lysidine synthase TilS/MesJ [Lachnospiraceae bacterium YSD2013]|nr:tRNA(Ile)-lysidine synthase TilS/MesJ [Lachnospiraceae bacterium YSD2013]